MRCEGRKAPNSKFCHRYGTPLDVETAIKIDEARSRIDMLLNKLTEDPEKLERCIALIEG